MIQHTDMTQAAISIRRILALLILAGGVTATGLATPLRGQEPLPSAPNEVPPTSDPPAKTVLEQEGLSGQTTPPESAEPAPTQQPTPATTTAQTKTPQQLLNDALDAMDQAALHLDVNASTQDALQQQRLAEQLLKQLLSASAQPESNSPHDSEPRSQDTSENSAQKFSDSQPMKSKDAGNRRRNDDSQGSSEEVTGPTQAGEGKNPSKVHANSIWGHLPPREQESLLRSLSDNFLPEYEDQIKRYYEALAEGKNGMRKD